MRFQAVHASFGDDPIDVFFGNDANRIRSSWMRDRADTSCLVNSRYDLPEWQIGGKRAAELDYQLSRFGEIRHVLHLDGGGQHVKRPQRTSGADLIEIGERLSVGFDSASGIGGVFLELVIDLVHEGKKRLRGRIGSIRTDAITKNMELPVVPATRDLDPGNDVHAAQLAELDRLHHRALGVVVADRRYPKSPIGQVIDQGGRGPGAVAGQGMQMEIDRCARRNGDSLRRCGASV